jgi:hypothetical protein
MSLREFYGSDAGRGLEVVCGLILLVPALLLSGGSIALIVLAPRELGTLGTSVVLGLIGWWLLRLVFRLLRGRGRVDGGLFGPSELAGEALIFVLGGVLSLVFGVAQKDVRMIATGLGAIPAALYAWRLARGRRRRSDA